ncbi:MAG: hypothetical protein J6331_09335 [Lentisphaeria bacterium]|nr:hypothetical protein [Lentisphaeria bacterium]
MNSNIFFSFVLLRFVEDLPSNLTLFTLKSTGQSRFFAKKRSFSPFLPPGTTSKDQNGGSAGNEMPAVFFAAQGLQSPFHRVYYSGRPPNYSKAGFS